MQREINARDREIVDLRNILSSRGVTQTGGTQASPNREIANLKSQVNSL